MVNPPPVNPPPVNPPPPRPEVPEAGWTASWLGHWWTVWPLLRRRLAPVEPPAEEPWQVTLADPQVGEVALTGRLQAAPGRDRLVVLVHGLGGSIDSAYMVRAARHVDALGLAALRLNLRGADHRGRDFYHAGLSGDLAPVLASPALARFRDVYVLGYSLGGHLVLRYATEVADPRVRAAAAVCSPLDLDLTVADFDRPVRWPYRRHVLTALCRMYTALDLPRPTAPLGALRRVRTLRGWDGLTVVPRFGFASAEDYYRRASVAHRLDRLRVPALLAAAAGDPMVSARSIRAALAAAPDSDLRVEWIVRGGHVYFPRSLHLGIDAPPGIEEQVIGWLVAQS